MVIAEILENEEKQKEESLSHLWFQQLWILNISIYLFSHFLSFFSFFSSFPLSFLFAFFVASARFESYYIFFILHFPYDQSFILSASLYLVSTYQVPGHCFVEYSCEQNWYKYLPLGSFHLVVMVGSDRQ